MMMLMFHEFCIGTFYMSRINYGVITLIQKTDGTTDLR